MNVLSAVLRIFTLVVLLQLVNCNHAPKADGKKPGPLFPQPTSVAANPEGGYTVNVVTGRSIQPLINAFGDILLTGVPIPVTPKMIHPDSVARPKSLTINQATLTSVDAHPNRHKVPKQKSTFPVDVSKLTKKIVPIVAENDTTHFIRNRTGTLVPTGVSIPATGDVVKAIHPQPTKALHPVFKDAAIANLQYLVWIKE